MKWVKSFLGLVSYYRRFFPGFAEVAKPLMDLTKDKTLFIWGASHQKSFDELKERLANAAVLACPDYSPCLRFTRTLADTPLGRCWCNEKWEKRGPWPSQVV